MEDLKHKANLLPLQRDVKSVTSRLFEAYLACPTKCYLQSIGEVVSDNDFAIWNETRSESYRSESVQRLTPTSILSWISNLAKWVMGRMCLGISPSTVSSELKTWRPTFRSSNEFP